MQYAKDAIQTIFVTKWRHNDLSIRKELRLEAILKSLEGDGGGECPGEDSGNNTE